MEHKVMRIMMGMRIEANRKTRRKKHRTAILAQKMAHEYKNSLVHRTKVDFSV